MLKVNEKCDLDPDKEQQTVSNPIDVVVSCEKITGAKLQLIVDYIEDLKPDIKVIKAELEELILRESGKYFTGR